MRFLALLLVLPLAACGGKTLERVVEVKVPVPVPCKTPTIVEPWMPLQEASLSEPFGEKLGKALAEIEIRKGYETELKAAVKSCQ